MLHGADYWRAVLDGASGIELRPQRGVRRGYLRRRIRRPLVCQPAGLPNRLYRNRGDGTFADITEASGVGIFSRTRCAPHLPISTTMDRQDLVVVRANGPLLFLNQGAAGSAARTMRFISRIPRREPLRERPRPIIDRDGLLDIYFCLYAYYQGTDQYKYPVPYYAAENGPPNFLMRNHGDGTFRDVTGGNWARRNNTRYSFCCGWGDSNGDGWPDLYVVNDFGRKNLYRNNGDGTFTDIAAEAGVEDVGAGMSVAWLDYDNDGAPGSLRREHVDGGGRADLDAGCFSSRTPPEAVQCVVSQARHGQFVYFAMAATRCSGIARRTRRPAWGDGRGRATHGISITTGSRMSISRTE